ncbi:MAG: FHA domain-containing protein [Bellilinea sp.]|nr:FHA domain-containing protein [Bellilinea sp.]
MKQFSFRMLLVFFILAGLVGGLAFEPTHSAMAQSTDASTSICVVTPPNAENFPDVTLEIRAIDQKYQSIPGITSSAIQVLDNEKKAEVTSLISNARGVGADIYFVIDQGNRTDQTVVKAALKRFGEKFMIDGKDRVTIITNKTDSRRNNPRVLLPMTNSLTDFIAAVNSLPVESDRGFFTAYYAHTEALNQIRGDSAIGCSRPRYLISIMGDDELSSSQVSSVSALAVQLRVPVHVVHVRHNGAYRNSTLYEQLSKMTYGLYEQVDSAKTGDFTQLDASIFTTIMNSRQSYTLQYRAVDGTSGSHKVNVQWSAQTVSSTTNTTEYTVTVIEPAVTLSIPTEGAVIVRTATQQIEKGFLYDIDTQTVQFQVDWPDGHPRRLVTAELLVQSQMGTATAASVVPSDLGSLSFEWDLRDLAKEGDNPVVLQVRVVDELGITALSQPVNVIVRNIIPSGMTSSLDDPFTRYLLIGLGALVFVLLVVVIIFWRRLSKLASSGAIGQMVNQVKKTILSGFKRGKPLAVLKVLDGPSNLIGKELPIFSENVTLGRDPQQADFTFYENANSTISGLHARLERVNGQWRLVAISKSGQETFLDDEALPMRQPVAIRDGQVFRMGYPAQQCVELEFHTTQTEEMQKTPAKPSRVTHLYDDESSPEKNKREQEPDRPRKTRSNAGDDTTLDDFPEFISPKDEVKTDYDDYFDSLRNR